MMTLAGKGTTAKKETKEMAFRNTSTIYGSVTKFFHWIIFFLVIGLLLVGFFVENIPDEATRYSVINAHKLSGLTTLILVTLWLLWSLVNPKPQLPVGTPKIQYILARTVHFLLYALLIAMPICGWVMTTASGHPPHFFGHVLALPISESEATASLFWTLHKTIAVTIIVLASGHISAALFHHFVNKDEVLRRML